MAPFYRGYDPAFSLDEDDILGIQALYGESLNQINYFILLQIDI